MSEQISFPTILDDSFVNNPEQRCPCMLILDVSGSMSGAAIAELNAGLGVFKEELMADPLAMKRVEVGIITFGPVTLDTHFQTALSFHPPQLQARGDTPMGDAIRQGIELVRQRKAEYRTHGLKYYKPWIFLITDGEPTDDWNAAAAEVREGEQANNFSFFAIGVRGANMDILRKISVRAPLPLEGLKFRELFAWLSSSLKAVSRSVPGTEVMLESPKGWASV